MNKNDLKLYAITDRQWLKENETLAQAVEEAIMGGATIIQLREKILSGDALKKLALEVQEICKKYGVPLIINDDVELAKEIDADGVHVGQSDTSVEIAKSILGPEKIVGATAKTIEQAITAKKQGADYLGSGAIFGTTTKLDAKPMTFELLDSICEAVDIPVVAIGGIDETNIFKLKGRKIAGAAIVSGIFAKENKRIAAIDLKDNLYGRNVIQCITNHVTVNEVANVCLSLGGSPIMAHHINEVEQIQQKASGLLINLGATDDYEAIKLAYKTALMNNHPVVIDPVGVGSSNFRRDFLKELLIIGVPTCIKGNFGEIKAILEDINTMDGLDNTIDTDEKIVERLAKKLGTVVAATGAVDIISNGNRIIKINSGSPKQKKITGSGCMLSVAICTLLATNSYSAIDTTAYACKLLGDTARLAARETTGSMSFLHRWIDLL